jgi:hypothetical protein
VVAAHDIHCNSHNRGARKQYPRPGRIRLQQ